jgi:hypothetical protein
MKARQMKPLLVLLLLALVSLVVCSCGGASKGSASASQVASEDAAALTTPTTTASTATAAQAPKDMDNDYDGTPDHSYFDEDDYSRFDYPQVADSAVKQEVTVLLKHYFADAVAANGAAGCQLVYSLLAEEVPEEYGEPPLGSAALRGSTCAEVMSKMFKANHKQLAAEQVSLEVAIVRLSHNRGLALLRFKGISARGIDVHREHGSWKVNMLFDNGTS